MGDRLKVVVTGASGLIGGSAVDALGMAGLEAVAVTRSGVRVPLPWRAQSLTLDLRDHDSGRSLIAQKPDAIVHAAAVVPTGFTGADAVVAGRENRVIDDTVFAAAATVGCPLVFVSSTSVYGCVQTMCGEESPIHPRGPYQEEKLRSEDRVLERGSGGTVLRISAPYGRHQRTTTVLHKFIGQALRGEDLLYYGSGAREQDFTAVEDVSSAIVAALLGRVGGVFNIASGHPITMRDLAALVVETVGLRVSRVRAAAIEDPEEHCRARIAIEKAERELRWRPAVSLRAGIAALASSGGAPLEAAEPKR